MNDKIYFEYFNESIFSKNLFSAKSPKKCALVGGNFSGYQKHPFCQNFKFEAQLER